MPDERGRFRVLLLNQSYSGGGAELVAATICRNLAPERFDVSLCHLRERGERGEELAGDGYRVFGLSDARGGLSGPRSMLKLVDIVKSERFDLIHSHSTDALVAGSVARLLDPGVRLIHTFHFGNYPRHRPDNLRFERAFHPVPDALVAVGYEQRKTIRATYGMPESRIVTVWNGVDPPKSDPDGEIVRPYRDAGKVVIGTIGTFIEQKGLGYLLDVAFELRKRTDRAVFLIAGGGPLEREMWGKAEQAGLGDTVKFLGWIPNAAARVLPVLDVFVQTSLWEAMSMAILEAMAVGKPVVATDVGENRHMVPNGVAGFIVPPRDAAAMVAALEPLIESEASRREMGEAGRRLRLRNFTAAAMVERYRELYDDVLFGTDRRTTWRRSPD